MKYTFDQIEERDVDFIVMRAFAEVPAFAEYFLEKAKCKDAQVISVEHSKFDLELGESDITIVCLTGNKKHGLLIENKIDALAMEEQCARYYKRGELGKANGEYDEFTVFLIAPQEYLRTNQEAQKYENQISYEELLTIFNELGRNFDSKIIKDAIEKQARGYMVQEVPAITSFWEKLYQYCSSADREIEMYQSKGPKGTRSSWPQFRIPLKGAVLYYKANDGVVDLQFTGKLKESLRLKSELSKFILHDMHWADTGQSISLRLKVKKMNFHMPFEEYIQEVNEMLDAVEKLTALAVKLNDIGYVV